MVGRWTVLKAFEVITKVIHFGLQSYPPERIVNGLSEEAWKFYQEVVRWMACLLSDQVKKYDIIVVDGMNT